MAAKKALGKGLSALFRPEAEEKTKPIGADASSQAPKTGVLQVPIDQIQPNRKQPRKNFKEDALAELAESIKTHGVAQPLVVTQSADGQYELVLGERRLRASKLAGLESVPVLVRSLTNRQRHELALIENIQREDLDPLEEALSFDSLMREHGLTQEQVAMAIGISRSAVANTLRFLRLHEDVQSALRGGQISEGHAKCLAGLQTHSDQLRFLNKIVEENWTVRFLEKAISQTASPKKKAAAKKSGSDLGESQRIEEELQRLLGRRVEIQSSGKKGWIRFAFYSPWDLDLLLKKLGLSDQSESGDQPEG